MTHWRKTTLRALFGLLALGSAHAALAQGAAGYPGKPVNIVVGFAPGTATDLQARVLGERFAARLGKTFTVENRPGQAGSIGAASVAKAAPDGYTLILSATSPMAINPNLYPDLPYDSARDFAPIGLTGYAAFVLVVNPNIKIDTLEQMLGRARAQPGKLNFATTGNGTTSHLSMALLMLRSGTKLTHIPYKGSSSQAQTDVMSGQVDLTFDSIVSLMPHVKSGKLKALGVSSLTRSLYAPEIPTIHEQGFAGFDTGAWLGLLAPAGTPKPIIDKLNHELNAILAEPDTQKRLLAMGFDMRKSTPEEFASYIQSEKLRWGQLVRESGAKID